MPETSLSCVLRADGHRGLTEAVCGLLQTAFGTVVIHFALKHGLVEF